MRHGSEDKKMRTSSTNLRKQLLSEFSKFLDKKLAAYEKKLLKEKKVK